MTSNTNNETNYLILNVWKKTIWRPSSKELDSFKNITREREQERERERELTKIINSNNMLNKYAHPFSSVSPPPNILPFYPQHYNHQVYNHQVYNHQVYNQQQPYTQRVYNQQYHNQ